MMLAPPAKQRRRKHPGTLHQDKPIPGNFQLREANVRHRLLQHPGSLARTLRLPLALLFVVAVAGELHRSETCIVERKIPE